MRSIHGVFRCKNHNIWKAFQTSRPFSFSIRLPVVQCFPALWSRVRWAKQAVNQGVFLPDMPRVWEHCSRMPNASVFILALSGKREFWAHPARGIALGLWQRPRCPIALTIFEFFKASQPKSIPISKFLDTPPLRISSPDSLIGGGKPPQAASGS